VTSSVDVRIGRNVRRLRVERGLACGALAGLVHINESSLRAYELGEKRVPPELFYRLALAMDVSISSFFEIQDVLEVARPERMVARLH
jgi:transcriptional regulator with XRE-family HTH domain